VRGLSIRKHWLKLSGYGALWLTAATLLTKLIGVLQKIPLQNLAGDAVFGIYNIVYPIYQLMMALAIAGIPTALASYIAVLRPEERLRSLRVALVMSSVTAIILSLIVFTTAPMLGEWIGHPEIASSLRVLAAALCVTPLIAVYRGFYQGIDDARSSSLSQLIEQLVRVCCMLLALWIGLSMGWSDGKLTAGVMWGSAFGAGAALLWLWYQRPRQPFTRHSFQLSVLEARSLVKLALPTALAAIVVPIVAVVDALSIPRLLQGHAEDIMAQFGQYSRIQPLIQLVSMLLGAFAAGFLPRWMNYGADPGALRLLGPRLLLMHRMAWFVGCGATVGLLMLAEPINIMLYKDTAGLETFCYLCLTTLTSSLLAVQAPLLQAAGVSRLPLWLLVIAGGSKALLNIWLVPIYGITGAAIAANFALLLPACLGAIALKLAVRQMSSYAEQTKDNPSLVQSLISTAVAMLTMGLTLYLFQLILLPTGGVNRLEMTLYSLMAVVAGALAYSLALWITRGVTKQEITWLG